jgi:hypothetical protein
MRSFVVLLYRLLGRLGAGWRETHRSALEPHAWLRHTPGGRALEELGR